MYYIVIDTGIEVSVFKSTDYGWFVLLSLQVSEICLNMKVGAVT